MTPDFFAHLIVSAALLLLVANAVSGIEVRGAVSAILAALVLGLVNAFVRPIAIVLTLPLTILTLGLFLLVVNAAMLGLVAWLLPGFSIAGLGTGILAWIIVSVTSWLASSFIGPSGRFEVLVVRRD